MHHGHTAHYFIFKCSPERAATEKRNVKQKGTENNSNINYELGTEQRGKEKPIKLPLKKKGTQKRESTIGRLHDKKRKNTGVAFLLNRLQFFGILL